MMHPDLRQFRSSCETAVAEACSPAQIVRRLAPHMLRLVQAAPCFVTAAHRRGRPDRYARNLIHAGNDGALSLFMLVWAPGQWTPIHDHGTWGVVGIVEGLLEEQTYMRVDRRPQEPRDRGIELLPGGLVLLPPGAVSTFVPNPDHIHRTGVAAGRAPTLSLHLYGRVLNDFHVYDRQAGTRERVRQPCEEAVGDPAPPDAAVSAR